MPTLQDYEYLKEAAKESGKINSRFDFTFDQETEFRHFTLENPVRVVLDFAEITKVPATQEIMDDLIVRVRFGRPEPGILRVVFDLERMHPYEIAVEQNPFRVTVRFSRTLLHVFHDTEVVTMELEDYLAGVVAAEMPALFHGEALRAQSVASRSYTVRKMKALGGTGCSRHPRADICTSSSHCQGWLSPENLQERWSSDYTKYSKIIDSAVRATQWKVLSYDGKVANTVFHSTCGGRTEDASVIWGNKIPYLQSVPCEYDGHSPYFTRTYTFSMANLLEKVGVTGEVIPALQDGAPLLQKKQESAAGTIQEIVVGGKVITGAEFRRLFELPSQKADWSVSDVTLTTKGFGHGVGLCQYGADGYGKNGWSWQQILTHYYRGTETESIAKTDSGSVKPLPLNGVTIAIDPGHGGRTIGAVGPSGLVEKDIVLKISKLLKELLRDNGAAIVMTRDSDTTVSLQERLRIADEADAVLFLSIHLNGHDNQAANGIESYYYNALSRPLAEHIQNELVAALGRRNRGVKQGAFYVLRYAKMPSVLAEIAFLTNPEEEKLLNDTDFQEKAANALFAGIRRHLNR